MLFVHIFLRFHVFVQSSNGIQNRTIAIRYWNGNDHYGSHLIYTIWKRTFKKRSEFECSVLGPPTVTELNLTYIREISYSRTGMVPNGKLSTNYGLGWFWIKNNIFQWSNSLFFSWLTTAHEVPSPSPWVVYMFFLRKRLYLRCAVVTSCPMQL